MNSGAKAATKLTERTRDAVIEGRACDEAGTNPIPTQTYFTGLLLLLAAVVMLFAGLTSALVVRKGISGDWRPLPLPRVACYSTILLLFSSFWMERVRHRYRARKLGPRLGRGLAPVLALGLSFALAQMFSWVELRAQGVHLGTNPSASFYYLMTAVYAALYFGGLGAVCYLTLPLKRMESGDQCRTIVDVVAIAWYSLTGLWIYLLVLFVTIM